MKVKILILQILIFYSTELICQWSSDTTQNNPICTAINEQTNPKIVTDDLGGGIFVWEDYRTDGDIYAQRISAEGSILWAYNGVPICTAANAQDQIVVTKDNNGGAFVAWVDRRISSFNTNIFVQRIDSSGNLLWTQNGVSVCLANGNQLNPDIIQDGTGGIIVAWTDFRNNNADIYVQRISSDGISIWQTDGIAICDTTDDQALPKLVFVNDDTLGVIIVWEDNRNTTSSQRDLFAQRIDLNGTSLWERNGKVIVAAENQQRNFKIVNSTDNHHLIAWEDYRSSVNGRDIWVQKFDNYGNKKWGDGINISARAGTQFGLSIVSDGLNNLFITYRDQKNATNWVIAQKIDENGNKIWADTGVVLGTISTVPMVILDNADNPIFFFEDGRNSLDDDIYASKLDQDGNYVWRSAGVPVSTAPNNQGLISAISDDFGGAIVVWEDNRSDTADIYCSRIYSNGTISSIKENKYITVNSFELSQNYPNPFNPSTKIKFSISDVGTGLALSVLKVYDILGNEVATLVNEEKPAGSYEVNFDASGLSSGIYFYRLQAGEFTEVKKMIILK